MCPREMRYSHSIQRSNINMIVMASDYVGEKVIEYLVNQEINLDYVVLDSKSDSDYNGKIIDKLSVSDFKGEILNEQDITSDIVLGKLSTQKLNLGILAWWPYILKGEILHITEKGWLNFHPSYLPYNRGKAPNFWCLAKNQVCGVSLHFIDEGIDTGPVVATKKLTTTWEDTGKTVYYRSRDLIIELFKDTFEDIVSGNITSQTQEKEQGTFHTIEELEQESLIDIDGSYVARDLLNKIRAKMFDPHPTAYFYDNEKKYSVEINIKEVEDDG